MEIVKLYELSASSEATPRFFWTGDDARSPVVDVDATETPGTRNRVARSLTAANLGDFDRSRRAILAGTYTLSVECRIAASHVLEGCPPCDRPHGHTWTVRAHWRYGALDAAGMGANFHDLRDALERRVRAAFDHRHLNDVSPFDRIAPTAENLARVAFEALRQDSAAGVVAVLARVEVWEGPESCAAYEA